jgi:hypothetical protein
MPCTTTTSTTSATCHSSTHGWTEEQHIVDCCHNTVFLFSCSEVVASSLESFFLSIQANLNGVGEWRTSIHVILIQILLVVLVKELSEQPLGPMTPYVEMYQEDPAGKIIDRREQWVSPGSPCTSSSARIWDFTVCPPEFLIVRNPSFDFERKLKISRELFQIVTLFI